MVYLGGRYLWDFSAATTFLTLLSEITTFEGIFFWNFTVFVTLTQMKTALYKTYDLMTCYIGVIICQKAHESSRS